MESYTWKKNTTILVYKLKVDVSKDEYAYIPKKDLIIHNLLQGK